MNAALSYERTACLGATQGSHDPVPDVTPDVTCKTSRNIFSSCLPFYRDGVTNDADNLIKAIELAVNENKTLVMERGDYLIGTTAGYEVPANMHLDMILQSGAKLIAGAGQQEPVLAIDGDRDCSRLTLEGPGSIDVTQAGSIAGGQGATGLQLRFLDTAKVSDGVKFINGINGYKDQTGDSGITANSIQHLTVENCYFQGCDDSGVYVTGSALPDDLSDDGGNAFISNNNFYRCRNDVSTKRQYRSLQFVNNYSKESFMGFTAFGAGSGGVNIPSGVNNVITGNVFDRTVSPVRLRTSSNTTLQGNIFIDWGVEYDGNDLTSSQRALLIDGVEGVIAMSNTFDSRNTNPAYAIEVRDYTYNGQLWEGGAGRFDNVYLGNTSRVFADKNASRGSNVEATGDNIQFTTGAIRPDTFVTIMDSASSSKNYYKGATLLQSL